MTRARTLVLAIVLQPVVLALAAAPAAVIGQKNRAFTQRELSIKRGDTVRFSNVDEFIHHIFVRSPAFSFNSGEQEPGRDVDVQFPTAGRFEVRCEIHPRMLVNVTVE